MAVLYKLYQNNRKNSSTIGQWYARATMTNDVNLDKMADIIQRNCSMKKSDVLAVLTELVEVMQDELQASHRVKIDGFGSFKIGLRSKGAESAKQFSATKHITGLRVNFQPEVKTSADKTRKKTFLSGCAVQEATDYHVEKEEVQEP